MTRALAVFAVLVAASPAWANTGTERTSFGERKGCDHIHRSEVAYERIRDLLRHTGPVVAKAKVRHYATCVATRAKAHRAHELARSHWAWRHQYTQLWQIRLARMPAGWVQWARNITSCESGWNRYARDYATGSHVSYFQWALSTWAAAGGTGHPFDASWAHQAVLAIRWAWKAGTSQWVCKG
jgi:hypothetical protein